MADHGRATAMTTTTADDDDDDNNNTHTHTGDDDEYDGHSTTTAAQATFKAVVASSSSTPCLPACLPAANERTESSFSPPAHSLARDVGLPRVEAVFPCARFRSSRRRRRRCVVVVVVGGGDTGIVLVAMVVGGGGGGRRASRHEHEQAGETATNSHIPIARSFAHDAVVRRNARARTSSRKRARAQRARILESTHHTEKQQNTLE